jgi:hypothetical protein
MDFKVSRSRWVTLRDRTLRWLFYLKNGCQDRQLPRTSWVDRAICTNDWASGKVGIGPKFQCNSLVFDIIAGKNDDGGESSQVRERGSERRQHFVA